MAKPYDPKLNPNKSLEQTIENFIAWIRTSNRGTASVLKNISDKLLDISKTEQSLKDLESSQIANLNK
jgi:K+/H+ antiporter YhaU regulatory subunit KhtT